MRPHGTNTRYVTNFCRCDLCRRAHADYAALLRSAGKIQGTAKRTDWTFLTESRCGRPEFKDVDFFAPTWTGINQAKAVCSLCPVKDRCLEVALTNHEGGVWGGTTWAERQTIERRRRSERAA